MGFGNENSDTNRVQLSALSDEDGGKHFTVQTKAVC